MSLPPDSGCDEVTLKRHELLGIDQSVSSLTGDSFSPDSTMFPGDAQTLVLHLSQIHVRVFRGHMCGVLAGQAPPWAGLDTCTAPELRGAVTPSSGVSLILLLGDDREPVANDLSSWRSPGPEFDCIVHSSSDHGRTTMSFYLHRRCSRRWAKERLRWILTRSGRLRRQGASVWAVFCCPPCDGVHNSNGCIMVY